MTLRKVDIPGDVEDINLNRIKAGLKLDGQIKHVTEYGLLIQLKGSNIVGLCHKSEVQSNGLH